MSSDAPVVSLLWEATDWDDPRVAALREEMNHEIAPRYAPADGSPRYFPPGPVPEEVLVSWLALVDGAPAATASLRRLEVVGEPLRYEVKRVFVAAARRRRGLAVQSLLHVEATAREHDVTRLVLQTGNRQPEAMALYEREGWAPIAAYPPYDLVVHSRCYAKDL